MTGLVSLAKRRPASGCQSWIQRWSRHRKTGADIGADVGVDRGSDAGNLGGSAGNLAGDAGFEPGARGGQGVLDFSAHERPGVLKSVNSILGAFKTR